MTEQRLRDLVHDLADDLTSTDGPQPYAADRAWTAAGRRRRRGRVAAVGGVAAVTLAAVGVARWVDPDSGNDTGTDRPPATDGPSPSPAPTYADTRGARPDARSAAGPVYWSPTPTEEAGLPRRDGSGLPARIDLDADAPPVEERPVDEVLAAFAVSDDDGVDRVVLVASGGGYRTLDVSRLDKVTRPNGYRADPEDQSMVSPEGDFLMFPQDGHLMVYAVASGRWQRIDTGDAETAYATWIYDAAVYLPPRYDGGSGPVIDVRTGTSQGGASVPATGAGMPLRTATPYGRHRTGPGGSAQSWSSGADLPVPDGAPADPELLVTTRPRLPVLAFVDGPGVPARWKQCCPVAGWLDEQTVVYESRQERPRLVAWRVGTHDFGSVTEIGGFRPGAETYVASFARFWTP